MDFSDSGNDMMSDTLKLMIKMYSTGKMTQHLSAVNVGMFLSLHYTHCIDLKVVTNMHGQLVQVSSSKQLFHTYNE